MPSQNSPAHIFLSPQASSFDNVPPHMDGETQDRELWNKKAKDWHAAVGNRGDDNRFFNSDPILWEFLGEVSGYRILDAGCGTGYLSRALASKGATVIGIDYSETMIEQAKSHTRIPNCEFTVGSCHNLLPVKAASIDKLVSNYVIMDVSDLFSTCQAFHRVLRHKGIAVVVFSHPCFPQSEFTIPREDGSVNYRWEHPYFTETRMIASPWPPFTSEFSYYHRPLSTYWKAFVQSGFIVEAFEEPVISDERKLEISPSQFLDYRARPTSVAFKLRKIERKAQN